MIWGLDETLFYHILMCFMLYFGFRTVFSPIYAAILVFFVGLGKEFTDNILNIADISGNVVGIYLGLVIERYFRCIL